MLLTPLPCHKLSHLLGPLPLERDVLYGRPLNYTSYTYSHIRTHTHAHEHRLYIVVFFVVVTNVNSTQDCHVGWPDISSKPRGRNSQVRH